MAEHPSNARTAVQAPSNGDALSSNEVFAVVEAELHSTLFIDVHTHLFMPSLGELGLWGIDELVTYHYLEAELFRSSIIGPDSYFALSKRAQADLIWQKLFVENAPVSEATRGVVAVLSAFGLPTSAPDLRSRILRPASARAACGGRAGDRWPERSCDDQ